MSEKAQHRLLIGYFALCWLAIVVAGTWALIEVGAEWWRVAAFVLLCPALFAILALLSRLFGERSSRGDALDDVEVEHGLLGGRPASGGE